MKRRTEQEISDRLMMNATYGEQKVDDMEDLHRILNISTGTKGSGRISLHKPHRQFHTIWI
jgi:hypothetical protein